MHRWTILGVCLSLAAHLAMGAGVAAIPKDVAPKHSLVSVFEKKKKPEEKKAEPKDEPPPPPPKPKEPRAAPKPKAVVENTPPPPSTTPPPSAVAHPQLAALPNLGISMAGGPGGGVGIAIPLPQAAGAADGARTVEGPAPKPKPKEDDCTEAEVKATPIGVPPQPTYTDDARNAGIEGRVRVSMQIDASGNVTSVSVLTGLGHGLDEAALAAAKRAKFKPATRCGKPVASHQPMGYRFVPPE